MLSPLSSSVNSLPINDNNSYCPFSLAASASGFLAIVVGAEPSGATSIAVYKINADGSLTFVPNSLVSVDAGVIEFDPSGKYLGVGSSLSGTSMPGGVRIFQLSGTTLSPVGKVQNPETAFEVVKWDNSGHLYALSMESKSLFIYDVNQGVITPAPGSPHPVPSPGSLAVVPQ
jgi:6-phosphogluconolactonase (cycloisomerase 2 family)